MPIIFTAAYYTYGMYHPKDVRRNLPFLGEMFLSLNNTDIIKHTYIRSEQLKER